MYVLKVGGSAGIDYDAFADDLAALGRGDGRGAAVLAPSSAPAPAAVAGAVAPAGFVLVHGGSAELNELSTRLGKPPRMITSASGVESRYTDAETLDHFLMVYAGKMNKRLVERLWKRGVRAVGLSGADGGLWRGPRKAALTVVEGGKKKVIRDDMTGKVERVDAALLRALLDGGWLPVLAPPALSDDNELINVDGDRAAAATAGALGAEALLIFSNVPGLLRDPADPATLVRAIPAAEAERFGADFARGRFKKKIMGAVEALALGVKKVVFADARGREPVRRALAGEGTVIS
ncbi:MAG TPA: [LysW]-aminoadipate kinase [Myxococcota bacterium]|jgi:acetylglutamate/LysW-gamma-L-alpha-aminoadipate kinase|nr:[LysW]-aminoadipate kinase [Myxococcota bacterium]